MPLPNLQPEEMTNIIRSPAIRKRLARENIRYFFGIYFSTYISSGYPMAPFHEDFFTIAENDSIPLAIILGFRGCAKSTLFSLCYPIWATTGKQHKKFILIFTRTQEQARKIMSNIKSALEDIELLKADIGPFEDTSEEWRATSIVLNEYNARIMVASVDQDTRGLLYKQYRPDVTIFDDILDLESVKTKEGRNKLFEWYTGDVAPMGDLHTRHIFLGTRLHNDDLLSRLIQQIDNKERNGIHRFIPIITKDGIITWPGKYKDVGAIEYEKQKIGNRIAWEREYLGNILSPREQLFKPEWISYYNKLPHPDKLKRIIVGVDPAIKESETADYTAMVIVYVYENDIGQTQFYIGTPIVNAHLTIFGLTTTGSQIYTTLPKDVSISFAVETGAYQLAALQELDDKGIPVEEAKTHGQDKYTRASIVSTLFEQMRVFFPEHGAENLITQLTGFPNEKHDDMVDALVYALLKALEQNDSEPQIFIADMPTADGRGLTF